MLDHPVATFPTATVFVVVMLSFLAFAASAAACDRSGHLFVAAFLAAGAWLFAAALALLTWLTFRR
jgi:hypothetical protein